MSKGVEKHLIFVRVYERTISLVYTGWGMNGPGYLLSYDNPNEYGPFPSGTSDQNGPKSRRGGSGGAELLQLGRCPFAIPGNTISEVLQNASSH